MLTAGLMAGFADDGAATLAVAVVDGAAKFFGYCHAQKEKKHAIRIGLTCTRTHT